jgi:predicted esterase
MDTSYETYRELDAEFERLLGGDQLGKALTLLEQARDLFPERLFTILWNRCYVLAQSKAYDELLDAIEEIIEQGFFTFLSWDIFDPIREEARFKAAALINQERLKEAREQSKMSYEVIHPEGVRLMEKAPWMIVLHGNGDSMEDFKRNWWLPDAMLAEGFSVAYVQSSQVLSTGMYEWMGDAQQAREDIHSAYERILLEYPLDPEQVYMAGFSGGAVAALDVLLAADVPARGFILLSPLRLPEHYSPGNLQRLVDTAVRGVIFRGELEGQVEIQEQMLSDFNKAGIAVQTKVLPGVGHTVPLDFGEHLRVAIQFLRPDA